MENPYLPHFRWFTEKERQAITQLRQGETKLGEKVCVGLSDAAFAVFGIPESIGVRQNRGVAGTETLWSEFLTSFLNIQSTSKLSGDEAAILGHFEFPDNISVEEIDKEVSMLVSWTVRAGKKPIAVGGGHNNCYPLLVGVSVVEAKSVSVINLDAHADFRRLEGRHSGNGFSYARRDGILNKYVVVGLHENYNSQTMVNELTADARNLVSFFEDIFLREKYTFKQVVLEGIRFLAGEKVGLELDLDSIERVLSSAGTPSGVSALHARQYLTWCANELDVSYVHIAEGAVALANGRTDASTAKLVSYLVTDFLKASLDQSR